MLKLEVRVNFGIAMYSSKSDEETEISHRDTGNHSLLIR